MQLLLKWKLSCIQYLLSVNSAALFGITGEEYEEKLKLEEEKRAADEKYRYKRRQIKELQENLQVKYKQKSQLVKAAGCCHTNHLIESIEHSGTIFCPFSFTSYRLY